MSGGGGIALLVVGAGVTGPPVPVAVKAVVLAAMAMVGQRGSRGQGGWSFVGVAEIKKE